MGDLWQRPLAPQIKGLVQFSGQSKDLRRAHRQAAHLLHDFRHAPNRDTLQIHLGDGDFERSIRAQTALNHGRSVRFVAFARLWHAKGERADGTFEASTLEFIGVSVTGFPAFIQIGSRIIQKLQRELGLVVPAKKPTKATHRGHVWTWDFVHDATMRGGKLRMLNVLDKHTRECLCIHVDRRINARKVRQIISNLIDVHGAPEHIRSDNGSEFIERGLREWLAENKIKTLYIDPGSPWQNGFIESFNARLREKCLNREQLWTLTEARVVIEDWR